MNQDLAANFIRKLIEDREKQEKEEKEQQELNLQHIKNTCTRCTWKEKLPTINNPNYILLYGIAPNITDLTTDMFKQEYFKKPFELFRDKRYVRTIGAKQQSKADRNTIEMTINLNYLGVIIKRCNVIETSKISDIVQKAFNNNLIKSHTDEISFISKYCNDNAISAYTFSPKYTAINYKLSTMKIIKPKSYILVNPNIIIDVAIGVDGINKMVKKYNRIGKV